jgi:hypothetical protein
VSEKRKALNVLLAVGGLALAVGVGLAANAVSKDSIGLAAKPLRATQDLAPREARNTDVRRAELRAQRRRAAQRRARRRQRDRAAQAKAPAPTPAPAVTTEPGDDHGADDGSGKGRGRGRSGGGSDDSGHGSDD